MKTFRGNIKIGASTADVVTVHEVANQASDLSKVQTTYASNSIAIVVSRCFVFVRF